MPEPIVKPKILVVEDELEMLTMLKNRVSRLVECEIDEAPGGQAAIDMIKAKNYDLVLLDIKMPDKTGMDVIKEVKVVKPLPYIFIITAYSSPQVAAEAIAQGAKDFLAKPLDLNIFDYKIKQNLEIIGKLIEKKS